MRTIYRYILLAVAIPIYLYLLFGNYDLEEEQETQAPSYWTDEGEVKRLVRNFSPLPCTFHECFNFSKCLGEHPKIYVYPTIEGNFVSMTYEKILTVIKESAYYTPKYEEACLFILSVDTVDRDKISENYVRDVNFLIQNLPKEIWNDGENHIIFNLYHGTYPDYADHNLGFNTGKAIIARASPSVQNFRSGFDVSFPLFHKEHGLRMGPEKFLNLKAKDRHLISFKGKRYVYGIGSETRDALHHIHNGESVAMVTTCRHNTDWQAHQDDRCQTDNEEYDKWDYEGTMANSTFCLTPRGRRLGSFRFLESLRIGCIPVVLSDDWVLPFAEVLDWTKAAVVIAEENVLLVPDLLREIPAGQVIRMKEQGRFLYNKYFRDVESITLSTLRIVLERVRRSEGYANRNWNKLSNFSTTSNYPTALVVLGTDSERLKSWMAMSKIEGIDQVLLSWSSIAEAPAVLTSSPYIKCFEASQLPFITTLTQSVKFVFVDERMTVGPEDIKRLLKYVDLHPMRLIGIHGIEFDPILQTVNFAKLYNAIYPSLMAVHREVLIELQHAFPLNLLQECYPVTLNYFSSDLAMQAPIVIGKHPVLSYMQNSKNADCWKKVASRWKEGSPLHYSDFHYV